jgi:hypothetical protein
MTFSLAELIDLEQYPVDDLDGRGAEFVAQCQRTIDATAICHLPNFVRQEAVDAIQEETRAGRDSAYWVENMRRAYSWRNPDEYPAGHVVGQGTPNFIGTITTDQFAAHSAFVSLFRLAQLTEFLRRVLRLPTLHPVACPYLAANIKVMKPGCRHAWHFDQNESAVTFMFQGASQGGHYEYVPYLRDDDDENYPSVERILAGNEDGVVREDLSPGSFCLFRGRRSIHRVTEVAQGSTDRLLAVFSYHHVANHRYRDSTVRSVLGRMPHDYADSL